MVGLSLNISFNVQGRKGKQMARAIQLQFLASEKRRVFPNPGLTKETPEYYSGQ